MYSDKLQKMLEKLGIGTGDTIKVESGEVKIEGELMPKTEVGDPDTVIIKMLNGYNLGIKIDKNTKITKVKSTKQLTEFPFVPLVKQKGLPEVDMIWTGGTIGSKIEYKTGAVLHSRVKPEELLYYIPEIKEIANISVDHLFGTASENLSYIEWQKIAEATADGINKGAKGVVIAHGTDTMQYTAAALSFMLGKLSAPVIMTGSQRSGDRGSSDAFFNLAGAVATAARSDIGEVCICMHASSSDDRLMLIRGVKARKMHTSRRDAFRPINDRPIGFVSKNKYEISYSSEYRKVEKGKVEAKTKFEPKVAIVKAYPNSDPEIIGYFKSKGYKGLIIEGTGLGHTPVETAKKEYSWLPHIKRAVDDGLVVGITSQTIYGRTNSNVYTPLRLLSNAGAIHCEDMSTETAYVKLGWLLGNYKADKVKELLVTNLAGEINKRITYDEFLV